MHHTLKARYRTHGCRAIIAVGIIALLGVPGADALADGELGMYVGGAIGQSRIAASASEVVIDISSATYAESIDKTHAAFKIMLGARPISLLGAEIDYLDFGKPNGSLFGNPANVSMKGAAAFGVLYLPVPIVELYLKAGFARLDSTVSGTVCGPCACSFCLHAFQLDRTNTSGAGGLGAQHTFGSWAVRAEYERFNAAGGNPSLLSAGVTWRFL